MPDIAVRRLFSQQIEQPRFEQPEDLLAWMGPMQGQDYPGAKWSVGLRLPGSTDADVERALAAHRIVRTWPLRGTLHLVAAQDVRWILKLVGPLVIARNALRYRQLELDEPTMARSSEILSRALESGREISRRTLYEILKQNGISTTGQRGIYMLQRASLDGLIGQGAAPKNNPIFFSLGDLPDGVKTVSGEEALAELTRRYFTSRGPATLQDYIWWSGLPAAEARAGLELVKAELDEETIDGQTYWASPSTSTGISQSPNAHLLPGFDEYLIAYRDRSASLDPLLAKQWEPGNGMLSPTVVIDGRVAGAWKRTIRKNSVVINSDTMGPLEGGEKDAFLSAAQRFGDFLGLSVVLPE